MKTKIVVTLLVALWITNTFSQVKVSGRLVDDKVVPVEFANISLQSADKLQGTISDDQGKFEILILPGKYSLKISAIGYDAYEKELTIQTDALDLGEIQLLESSLEIGEVVVKADRIVRKADRFIVNLMNDPTVFGKTGTDILNQSPGIFIQERDGTISINGKTGTKVYINERPLHETGADLVRYLQTLKAEDIMRIEILPTAGAGYDANIHGGIIKITLKRHRDDGIYGHAGVRYFFAPSKDVTSFSPSYSMNYKNNRFSFYTQLNYEIDHHLELGTEDTWTSEKHIHSVFDFPIKNNSGRARIGGIYELSKNQSIGLEGYYSPGTRKNKSVAEVIEITNGNRTDVSSFYNGKNATDSYSASGNYILRLDSLGSSFKVLLDYFHNQADDNQNYHSEFRGHMNYDTIYRSNMDTRNDLYAVSADLSFRFNDKTALATGLKYIRNEMDNEVLFDYQNDLNWHNNELYSSENRFTEDIGAIYGSFSSQIKSISYSVGLRGEYTYASPWTNKSEDTKDQKYFELFPTANIMFHLGREHKHSLVLNYNRKISRPSFSQLNPFRLPASEYLYIEGNPKLKATFSDDYSIALGLFNKYNLIAGFTNQKDAIGKVLIMDPDVPGVIIQRMDNLTRRRTYYLTANASFNPVKWWKMNINLTGSRSEVEIFDETRTQNTFRGYISNTFTLPKGFMFDLNGYYSSPLLDGSVKMKTDPQVNVSLGRQFFDNKISARLYVNNLFGMGVAKVISDEADFRRNLEVRHNYRQFGISLSYNFKAGKSVQVKNVQTGAADEKARM